MIFFKDGTFTETDEEKVEILYEHFKNVYNRNVTIKWTIFQDFF